METLIIQSIRHFAVVAEDLQEKAKKGLLEQNTGHEFEDSFHTFFSENLKELDEESALEFKRDFATKHTRWTNLSNSIYNFYNVEQGLRLITPRKEFLDRLLLRNNYKFSNSGFIPRDKRYTARELLRDIISSAQNDLLLVDSYFHPKFLRLIGEIVEDGVNIKIKILTNNSKNNRLTALKDALEVFIQQYPNIIIGVKSGDIPHDRYIVLDSTKLYHFGASLYDLGVHDSSYSEIKETTELRQTIDALNKNYIESVDLIKIV